MSAAPLSIRAAGASHEGAIRQTNEDAWLFRADAAASAVAVVADGMGGSSTGRPAADLTVASCAEAFDRRLQDYAEAWWLAEHDGAVAWSTLPSSDRAAVEVHVRELLSSRTRSPITLGDLAIVEREGDVLAAIARRGILAANSAVLQRATTHAMSRGMGSTAVVAVFAGGVAGLAHVGDSRIYRLRDGSLELLTLDHSLLNEYIKANRLTPEEIASFPHRNVIVRAIGMMDTIEVDTQVVTTQERDLFLLCCDGIPNTFDDAFILEALDTRRADAATYLVEAARHAPGNSDNVTAVVVEIASS